MDAVLRFLTQPCQQPVYIENHEARLVDPTGEPVKISIEMFDTDMEISMLKLTIISREITLAAAVREAISRYLQVIFLVVLTFCSSIHLVLTNVLALQKMKPI